MKIAPEISRRKAERIPIEVEAVVHLIDHRASSQGKYPLVTGIIRNLSVSGALVELPIVLWPDTKIRLQFRAKGREYDRYAMICRNGLDDESGTSNGHGIRFMPRALATVRPPSVPIFGRRSSAEDLSENKPLPSFRSGAGFGTSIHIKK